MQKLIDLPAGKQLKLYYSDKVYNPEYSAVDTIIIADKLIQMTPEEHWPTVKVLDVACGTGVIGLGIKLLNPVVPVSFCDVDPEALRITKLNAKRLGYTPDIFESDLLGSVEGRYHIITANLPTFDEKQMATEELRGPELAYSGGYDGMDLYRRLFKQAKTVAGVLIVECQEKHQEKLLDIAHREGWTNIMQTDFGFAFLIK